MFGLSFGELLLTFLLIVALWRAYRLVQRWQERRAAVDRLRRAASSRTAGAAVELEACPLCGAYVPRGGPRCRSTEECSFAQRRGPMAPNA